MQCSKQHMYELSISCCCSACAAGASLPSPRHPKRYGVYYNNVHPSFVALVPECRIDRVYCVSQRTNAARQSLQCIGSLLNGHQSVKMQFLDLLPLMLSQISPYSLGQVKLCSAYHKQCTRFQLVSIWGGFWSQKASLGTGCTR